MLLRVKMYTNALSLPWTPLGKLTALLLAGLRAGERGTGERQENDGRGIGGNDFVPVVEIHWNMPCTVRRFHGCSRGYPEHHVVKDILHFDIATRMNHAMVVLKAFSLERRRHTKKNFVKANIFVDLDWWGQICRGQMILEKFTENPWTYKAAFVNSQSVFFDEALSRLERDCKRIVRQSERRWFCEVSRRELVFALIDVCVQQTDSSVAHKTRPLSSGHGLLRRRHIYDTMAIWLPYTPAVRENMVQVRDITKSLLAGRVISWITCRRNSP